jgi:hypothetical protein
MLAVLPVPVAPGLQVKKAGKKHSIFSRLLSEWVQRSADDFSTGADFMAV